MSKQKTHVSMFQSVPAGGWYSITEARVSSWSEQHARGKPKKSDQQQTIIQVSHWNLLCHRYLLLLVRKRERFVCDTLIFESRCRAHHVEAAPPISNVSTFPHTSRSWKETCIPQRRRRLKLLCTSRAPPSGNFLMATAGQPQQSYQRS